MDALDRKLLDRFQRGFPLHPRPYAMIGECLEVSEQTVIVRLRELAGAGLVRRVGAVVTPRRLGAGMLVAMTVPRRQLARVAARIGVLPEVNHSYERAHPVNFWFVVTAGSDERVEAVVRECETLAGTGALRLPLVEAFHLDLGFPLGRATGGTLPARAELLAERRAPSSEERALLAALQDGIPIDVRPYAMLAQAAGTDEASVLALIERWLGEGTVRRIGIIVEHRRLGYRANAMVVWDVPDEAVGRIGRQIAGTGLTTLCYRRGRSLPDWPYNLYCMMHGTNRRAVRGQLERLAAQVDLLCYPSQTLFSVRQFKQTGARYVEEPGSGRDRSLDHQSLAGRISGRGAAVSGRRPPVGDQRGRADRENRAVARTGNPQPVRPAV
jgi:DNA-binding Lrp family transcriptional regulator